MTGPLPSQSLLVFEMHSSFTLFGVDDSGSPTYTFQAGDVTVQEAAKRAEEILEMGDFPLVIIVQQKIEIISSNISIRPNLIAVFRKTDGPETDGPETDPETT